MKVFLSHNVEDTALAHAVKALVERCSLGRVSVWFSSDSASAGGMVPGGPWFDQLVSRIDSSSVFVALLTPRSAKNLWLHYEMGCAAIRRLPIMSLAVGLSINEIGLPASLYNTYFVTKPSDLKDFLMKLYAIDDVPHDEAMLETPVQRAAEEILRAQNKEREKSGGESADGYDRLLRLMDQRFLDLISALPRNTEAASKPPSFSVQLRVVKEGKAIDKFTVDIGPEDTLQDVANTCYFKIADHVAVYTYLIQWLIRDRTLNSDLVIIDIARHLKAMDVIRPGHQYDLVLLNRPFDPQRYRERGSEIA